MFANLKTNRMPANIHHGLTLFLLLLSRPPSFIDTALRLTKNDIIRANLRNRHNITGIQM